MELPRQQKAEETHEPTDCSEISTVTPRLEEAIKAAGSLAEQTGSEVTITVDGVTVTIKPRAKEHAPRADLRAASPASRAMQLR